MALCQLHHNRYDAPMRANNRKKKKVNPDFLIGTTEQIKQALKIIE
jgi:hypothetical protein